MSSIKINNTAEFFNERMSQSPEQKWRSLEHFLERHNREFIFDDVNKSVVVAVADESDAQRLMQDIGITSVSFCTDNGDEKQIGDGGIYEPRQIRDSVYVKREDERMSVGQYVKYLKSDTISKSAIVKHGILTKSELEKAISSGKLLVVKVGNSVRINQKSLSDYL